MGSELHHGLFVHINAGGRAEGACPKIRTARHCQQGNAGGLHRIIVAAVWRESAMPLLNNIQLLSQRSLITSPAFPEVVCQFLPDYGCKLLIES